MKFNAFAILELANLRNSLDPLPPLSNNPLLNADFETQILQKVGIPIEHASGQVASGGWKGTINPSGQIAVPAETDAAKIAICAALLGLIWRQDAVMISRLHPEGSRAAVLVSRADGKRFTKSQIQKCYETLYNQDVGKDATVGFFEVDGSMVFINGGDLTDDDFREVLRTLITRHLPGTVKLRDLRADMVLVSSSWSEGDGEDYRRTIRESGRSDLLQWVDDSARPQAEAFVANFDWKKGGVRAQEDSS
jgi:hypothetical protein